MSNQSRIKQLFAQQKAYVGYLTAGDGGIENTLVAARALIAGGVNLLEIGVPFSDPIADGPVIQRASVRALANGTTLIDILSLVKKIREQSDTPIILFSYLNPILAAMHHDDFLLQAKSAGVDGLLLVDCPLEESENIQQQCAQHQLALIYVITPSTPVARLKKINQLAQGFLYYVCRKGTTGIQDQLPADFTEKMQVIKSCVQLPVVVGFGIATTKMFQSVLQYADGVAVGSLFVKAIEDKMPSTDLSQLVRNLSGYQ